jgi:hypothetical protein
MKKYLFLTILSAFLLVFQNCSSQTSPAENGSNAAINLKNFVFHAERANPMSYDAVNVVSSLPGGSISRILDISSNNYTFSVKENALESVLPYFGTRYNAAYGNTDLNSYRFNSKDFAISQSQGRKSKTVIKIQPKDVSYVSEIYLEVFPNGKAYLSIKGNDRQPISYDGFVRSNEK